MTPGSDSGPLPFTGFLCRAYEWGGCYFWSLDEDEVREHMAKGEHRA